jgi:ankyrin repeat protein
VPIQIKQLKDLFSSLRALIENYNLPRNLIKDLSNAFEPIRKDLEKSDQNAVLNEKQQELLISAVFSIQTNILFFAPNPSEQFNRALTDIRNLCLNEIDPQAPTLFFKYRLLTDRDHTFLIENDPKQLKTFIQSLKQCEQSGHLQTEVSDLIIDGLVKSQDPKQYVNTLTKLNTQNQLQTFIELLKQCKQLGYLKPKVSGLITNGLLQSQNPEKYFETLTKLKEKQLFLNLDIQQLNFFDNRGWIDLLLKSKDLESTLYSRLNQIFLFNLMKRYHYLSDPKGMCFGLTQAWLQAVLLGSYIWKKTQVDAEQEFYQRLIKLAKKLRGLELHLSTLGPLSEKERNNQIEQYLHGTANEAKEKLQKRIEKYEAIKKNQDALESLGFSQEEAQSMLEEDEKEILHRGIKFKVLSQILLSDQEREALKNEVEFKSFFDIVELLQQPERYLNIQPTYLSQDDIEQIYNITSSAELKRQKESIESIYLETRMDKDQELKAFLDALITISEQYHSENQKIVFSINGYDHVIAWYHDQGKGENIIFDANAMTGRYAVKDAALAGEIKKMLTHNDALVDELKYTAFRCKAYVLSKHPNRQALSEALSELKNRNLKKINPNTIRRKGANGITPVYMGTRNLDLTYLEQLRERSDPPSWIGTVNTLSETDKTSIMLGAYDVNLLEFLLKSGADPNITNSKKHSPLHFSIVFRNKESVELLLKNRADPNQQDIDGNTPLHYSIRENQIEISEILLKHNADPNQENNNEETPLDVALRQNNKDLAMLLLKNKASVNSQHHPLHWVFDKDKELLDLLLETAIKETVDLDQPNKDGKTPLERAEEKDLWGNAIRIRLYKIRLATSINPNIPDNYKESQKNAFKKLIQQIDKIENQPILPGDKVNKLLAKIRLLQEKFFELEETIERLSEEKTSLELIIKAYNEYAKTGDVIRAKKYITELQPSTSQTTLYKRTDRPAERSKTKRFKRL